MAFIIPFLLKACEPAIAKRVNGYVMNGNYRWQSVNAGLLCQSVSVYHPISH